MAKGFLSFVLGAVFLLALLSSGAKISSQSPDRAYQKYLGFHAAEISIKQSYYRALSEAASEALVNPPSTPAGIGSAAKSAMLAATTRFEQGLQQQGFDALFWCGSVAEEAKEKASEKMAAEKQAIYPEGSLPSSLCLDSFDANLLEGKAHLHDMGFSYYSKELGIGAALSLPSSYEVDFS